MKTKNFKFKSMALVLFALVLSSNVWGAEVTSVYSTGFEKCSTGSNYQGTVTIDTEKGDGASWTIYYGCVSTNSKISGNNSAQMRLYSNGNCGYMEQTSNIATVDSINFTYAVSNKAVRFDVKYSTNSGSSWTTLASIAPSGTAATTLAYRLSAQAATFRLKIEVTGGHPSSSNYTLRIDDVNYYKIAAPSKTLSSIAVTTPPTKKSYTTCETLDLSGCVVTATYSDGSTENVTSSCTFTPANGAALTKSVKSVAVSYEGEAATIPDISVTEGASDTYVDNVHGLTPSGDFSCSYKAPSLKDRTKGETSFCEDTHYHFVGWVEDGVDPQTNPVISAGTDMTGSNKTYKAVWAAEENE